MNDHPLYNPKKPNENLKSLFGFLTFLCDHSPLLLQIYVNYLDNTNKKIQEGLVFLDLGLSLFR
jgi:hypothetical protein